MQRQFVGDCNSLSNNFFSSTRAPPLVAAVLIVPLAVFVTQVFIQSCNDCGRAEPIGVRVLVMKNSTPSAIHIGIRLTCSTKESY